MVALVILKREPSHVQAGHAERSGDDRRHAVQVGGTGEVQTGKRLDRAIDGGRDRRR